MISPNESKFDLSSLGLHVSVHAECPSAFNAFHSKWHFLFVAPAPFFCVVSVNAKGVPCLLSLFCSAKLFQGTIRGVEFQNGRCSHLPLLLWCSSDLVSVVRHDWAQSPACHSAILSRTHIPVSDSYSCVAERWASLLYIAAPAVRPHWRKQGPDDCLHNRIVAMVTDPTGMSDVHLIAPYALSKKKRKEKRKWSRVVPRQIIILDISRVSPEGFSMSWIIKRYFIYTCIHLPYEVVKTARWLRGWMQIKEGKDGWKDILEKGGEMILPLLCSFICCLPFKPDFTLARLVVAGVRIQHTLLTMTNFLLMLRRQRLPELHLSGLGRIKTHFIPRF